MNNLKNQIIHESRAYAVRAIIALSAQMTTVRSAAHRRKLEGKKKAYELLIQRLDEQTKL